jgi:hypothetical protein
MVFVFNSSLDKTNSLTLMVLFKIAQQLAIHVNTILTHAQAVRVAIYWINSWQVALILIVLQQQAVHQTWLITMTHSKPVSFAQMIAKLARMIPSATLATQTGSYSTISSIKLRVASLSVNQAHMWVLIF